MKVSIIITAYNVEQFIARAVDSALAQDYKDVEVVVVNDCSTDKTTEILASYGDRIKLIQSPFGCIIYTCFGILVASCSDVYGRTY